MRDWDGGCWGIFLTGVLTVLVILGSWFWAGYTCRQRTANMGFASNYKISTGCMIEVEEGKWIPLENWRTLD